jgi:tetratricopeptide (TPR) repeat protein
LAASADALAAQPRPAARPTIAPAVAVTPTVEVAQRGLDSVLSAQRTSGAPAATSTLAAAYERLGGALEKVGHTPEALAAYRRAISTAESVRDSNAMSSSLYSLGLLHWTSNSYDSALVHLETARALRVALNDRPGLGRVLNSTGATYYQLGNYEPALDAFVCALVLRREEGDSAGVARILTNIGKTYHDWRQYARAKVVLEEAVATAKTADVPATVGYALNSLAMLHIDIGEFSRAREIIDAANAAYNAGAPRVSVADSIDGWSLNAVAAGRLLVREGRAAEALPLLDSVLVAGERRGSVRGQARSNLYLGEAYAALGQRARAKAAFLRSLDLSTQVQ